MDKHIRNAVLAFICCMIWVLLFYQSYGKVGMFHCAIRFFLAIAFFVNGIMEIRNYKKSLYRQAERKDRKA